MKKLLLFLLLILFFGQARAQFENFRAEIPGSLKRSLLHQTYPGVRGAAKHTQVPANSIDPLLSQMLQATLDAELQSRNFIGLTAAFIDADESIWTGVAGKNGAFLNDTMRNDLAMGVGSVTKTITGACILALKGEGVLNLDDSLHQWLPDFPNVDPDVTIRQLLNHTSGIYNCTDNPALRTAITSNFSKIFTPEEILNSFVAAPVFPKGTSWGYSNTNYILLGLIIEAATGHSYETELRQRFWQPLQLNQIAILPKDTIIREMGHLWLDLISPGNPVDLQALGISFNALFSAAWAAGAAIANPADIAVWMRSLVKGQVISADLLAEMEAFISVNSTYAYGLGLSRVRLPDGNFIFGHGGDIVFKTSNFHVPHLDITISVSTNDGTKPDVSRTWEALYNTYLVYQTLSSTSVPSFQQHALVYPNPFHESVFLKQQLNEDALNQIMVFDAYGKPVNATLGAQGGSLIEVNLSHLPNGVYFLKTFGNEGSSIQKITKY